MHADISAVALNHVMTCRSVAVFWQRDTIARQAWQRISETTIGVSLFPRDLRRSLFDNYIELFTRGRPLSTHYFSSGTQCNSFIEIGKLDFTTYSFIFVQKKLQELSFPHFSKLYYFTNNFSFHLTNGNKILKEIYFHKHGQRCFALYQKSSFCTSKFATNRV